MIFRVSSTFKPEPVYVHMEENELIEDISPKLNISDICPRRLTYFYVNDRDEEYEINKTDTCGMHYYIRFERREEIYLRIQMDHICGEQCAEGYVTPPPSPSPSPSPPPPPSRCIQQ